MAAQALGLLMAAVVELLMAVAARHTVVEVAVHTAIVKIGAIQKGPPLANGTGLLLSSPAHPGATAQLSFRTRVK